MDWKDEDVEQAWTAAKGMEVGSRSATKAIMTRAVELAAARGGTMTGPEISALFEMPWVVNRVPMERVQAHISTIGARNAVLEAENAACRERLEVRTQELKADLQEQRTIEEALRERLFAAEEGNRELVRRAQQAEANLEHATQARDYWMKKSRDLGERAEAAEARCATPSTGKQTESASPDLLGAWGSSAAVSVALKASGYGATLSATGQSVKDIHGHVQIGRCAEGGGFSERYPCSPTCTHDDAANPGHPERVRLLSASVDLNTKSNMTTGEVERAIANASEAMRAACWEAVQDIMQKYGIGPAMREEMKSAIEGAVP